MKPGNDPLLDWAGIDLAEDCPPTTTFRETEQLKSSVAVREEGGG